MANGMEHKMLQSLVDRSRYAEGIHTHQYVGLSSNRINRIGIFHSTIVGAYIVSIFCLYDDWQCYCLMRQL